MRRPLPKVCAATDPQQLWADRFLRMPGSGRAGYADQRTYIYNGDGHRHPDPPRG